MGQRFSRSQTTPGTGTTNEDSMRATGTYFGPNFVLESNGIAPGNSRAFLEDIMNVLSTNQDSTDVDQLQAFGDLYAQLPPAELKACQTIQSKVNLQKSTLRLSRVKEAQSLQYKLQFKFDLLESGYIRVLWGARERINSNPNGTTYTYVDKNGTLAKEWKFGPFPAGLNQVFELPNEFLIDAAILKIADMEWVTNMELETPLSPSMPMSPAMENQPPEFSAPNDPVAMVTPSVEAPSNPESVTLQIDPAVKSSSAVEPTLYNLIVIVELEHSSKVVPNVDCQSTFVSFAPSSDMKLSVQFMKQLLIIDGLSYVLQEIYGFTELESESPNASTLF
jgi:hypothetical protein